jgi:hypothetical protein
VLDITLRLFIESRVSAQRERKKKKFFIIILLLTLTDWVVGWLSLVLTLCSVCTWLWIFSVEIQTATRAVLLHTPFSPSLVLSERRDSNNFLSLSLTHSFTEILNLNFVIVNSRRANAAFVSGKKCIKTFHDFQILFSFLFIVIRYYYFYSTYRIFCNDENDDDEYVYENMYICVYNKSQFPSFSRFMYNMNDIRILVCQ